MTELQILLDRLLAGEIGLDELQQEFALLLQDDSDLPMSAEAWIDDGEKDGRLSATVCTALKNELASHMAAAFFDADPADSGIFDRLDKSLAQEKKSRPAGAGPAAGARIETLVLDSGSTAIGSQTAGSQSGPQNEQTLENQSVGVDAVLKVGSLIGGRYQLLSQLGSGGMGKVFMARDRLREEAQDRDPHIALKILGDEFKEHPDSMIAMQREAKRAQTLSHPNVINVHDFFRDGPHLYLTMELLEGKPLDQLLKTDYWGGLPFAQAWPIIESVCSALEYGHQKGIVHSDIKPANIFICDDGTVKVLDLGIARIIPVANVPETEQTVFDPGKRLGTLTPAYASLEMWYQDTPDPRDDIYALGCVAYMLLAGVHPFKGKSAKRASKENLVPKKIDSISRGQWSAISGGLRFHRTDRIESVEEFHRLLEPQSITRNRRRVAVLLALLAAVVLVPVGLHYYEVAVEQRAMDDRGRLQAPNVASAAVRPELTTAQQGEIDGLMQLAQIQMAAIGAQSDAENIAYVLSFGPNNVAQLVETVLQIDPGYEPALALRQRVYDVYLAKARQLEAEEAYQQAIALTRNAEVVIPNTSTVLRLQRSICSSAPAACVSQ